MAIDWEDRERYGRGGGYERDRGSLRGDRDRDWTDRAGDEVRSWVGDEDAERRRMEDDRDYRMRHRGRNYRGGYSDEEYGGMVGYGGQGAVAGGYREEYDRPPYSGYRSNDRQSRGAWRPDYGEGGWAARQDDDRGYRGRRYRGQEDRGFFDRAGDEVASWFGDEDAERRREMDARHRGRGPKNYTRSDDRIREDVNDRLSDDAHIDASDIEVSVNGGEVTLDGTVDERFAKRHAEDIAERVPGVKHVQNNLRIGEQYASTGGTGTATGSTAKRTSTAKNTDTTTQY